MQRTLVKSPPELWAELSDPDALGRHLSELGEIRITRAEPEKRVEWEAEGTSGSVLIKPSGWGTKVTLSVRREIEAPAQEAPEMEQPEVDQDVEAVELPAVAEIEPEPPSDAAEPLELEPEPESSVLEPEVEVPGADEVRETTIELTRPSEPAPPPAPRRGFFARLFGRRQPKVAEPPEEPSRVDVTDRSPISSPATGEVTITESAQRSSAIESLQARFQAEPIVEIDPEAEAAPEPVAEADEPSEESQEIASGPSRDLAAELKAAEEVAAEEVTAVLTAVLDRLGAAHHRPFSRA
ncbi:MAG TPA: hypothetical protein VGN25_07790 [Solirubrobacteraceae bacterium]|nr:hypothetical protein [Solirubrobacteraceae bacterium]